MPARVTMYVFTEIALKVPDKNLPVPAQYGESVLVDDKFLEPRGSLEIVIFEAAWAKKDRWPGGWNEAETSTFHSRKTENSRGTAGTLGQGESETNEEGRIGVESI